LKRATATLRRCSVSLVPDVHGVPEYERARTPRPADLTAHRTCDELYLVDSGVSIRGPLGVSQIAGLRSPWVEGI
jgi:hypothetical protein